jgi:Tol biopolymer transport system component
MMEADGSNHVQITTENFTQWRPKYSPDGSSIVYSSREDGGVFYDIWMLEL